MLKERSPKVVIAIVLSFLKYYLLSHCASCKIPKNIQTVPWSKRVFNNWFGTNKSISNDLFVKFHSFYEWICSRLIFLQIQDKHENYWQTSPCIWGYGHVTSTYDDNILEVPSTSSPDDRLLVVFRADFFQAVHSARLEWHNF